ncbi:MAG: glycosyltransferase family 2 protein [Lachnospiraceae bacterium]|nr:glycosyltransferase family 2 protein [Erysipelotrichaceae bacterium]MBR4342433.1 glycosyltransferase family 2 protein [Lachnospiraceae bacterium]
MLSVIIISYNEAQYLPEAINSCLNQTYKDMEIIIGDDGSSDNSIEIIKEYEKQYDNISHFVMDRSDIISKETIIPSYRVSNVIKRGISMAKGEYIVILSGDDYYNDSTVFEKQIEILDSNKEYYSCVSGLRKFWSDRSEDCIFKPMNESLYWSGAYTHISCFMFRKSIYDDGYFLNRFCDDTGLQYSIILAGKWNCLNKITFSYRQRSSSIMDSSDKTELALLELLMLQDIKHKNKLIASSLARFHKPLVLCFRERKELDGNKYKKYIDAAAKYDYDIINTLRTYDDASVIEKANTLITIMLSYVLFYYYKVARKIITLTYKKS